VKSLSKTDVMYEISYNPTFVPIRSSKVSVKTTTEGEETSYLMRNFETSEYYDLDEPSKAVWDLVDGRATVEQIRSACELGSQIKPDTTTEILLFFAESGALSAKEESVKESRFRVISAHEIEVVIVKEKLKFLEWTQRHLSPLFRPSLFWACMVFVLIAVAIYAPRFASTLEEADNFEIYGSVLLGFLFYELVVLAPVIVVHELSHALALVHYGGRVREIGTGTYFFTPVFYVDVTDSWSMPRRERLMIVWAGNLSTLLIGAAIAMAGLFLPVPPPVAAQLNMAAFWCFFLTLWQLAPPFETDGYYMLSDALSMPELRRDSFAYLKSVLVRPFRSTPPEGEGPSRREKVVFLLYGSLSIVFVCYVALLVGTFTVYMGEEVATWGGTFWTSLVRSEILAPHVYAMGAVFIAYFLLLLAGYGLLIVEQFRKALTRTLRVESVHDRDLAVFLYLPPWAPSSAVRQFEKHVRSVARDVSANFSTDHRGNFLHVVLRVGHTSLPLAHLKLDLRRVERGFRRAYQNFLRRVFSTALRRPGSLEKVGTLFAEWLFEMAGDVSPGQRRELKGSLRGFLGRQRKTVRDLMSSTFATVWTVEVPPAQQYELMEISLPSLLAEDVAMTDLVDEVEEFKKRTIYGSDTIANLATEAANAGRKALANPEEFQVVSLFEPVKGRITFLGRTEGIEPHIAEFGSLFGIQVWSGFVDKLLGEITMKLHTIAHSLPDAVDPDSLSSGEVVTLSKYLTNLDVSEHGVMEMITGLDKIVQSCKTTQGRLRTLFQQGTGVRIGLLDSVMTVNLEDLGSVERRIGEYRELAKDVFGWIRRTRNDIAPELGKRELIYETGKGTLRRVYALVGALSVGLAVIAVLGLLPLVPAAVGIAALHLGYFGMSLVLLRARRTVPRYPSRTFTQFLLPLFTLTLTCLELTGSTILDPSKS